MDGESQPHSAATAFEEATTIHLRRARAGDLASLAWIVSRLTPMLITDAEYRLGPVLARLYDAEDLVQEVWLTALPRLAEIGRDAQRRTPVLIRFLTTTLFNVVMGLVRRHVSGKPKQVLGAGPEGVVAALEALTSGATGAMTAAVRDESMKRLANAVAMLAPDDRLLVVLRGIEYQPYKDIAAVVGAPAPTLAVRYARALVKLRALLPASMADPFADD